MFYTGRYMKHDPKGIVIQHVGHVISHWPYAHDTFEDEIFTENTLDWEEVLQRNEDPDLTHFKAMSGNEQLEWLEHIIGFVVQEQNEDAGRETRRIEAQRLLEELERMLRQHGHNPSLHILGPLK
jgi:hypothetical protein